MNFRSLAFILAVLTFSTAAFSQSNDRTEDALKSIVKQMIEAQLNYDPAALDQVFTADYIEISPAGEFDPREKVLGFYDPKAKPDPTKFSAMVEAADYSIRIYDNFAVIITRLNFTVNSDGKTLPPRSMRTTLVFRKDGGTWKIASAQYTGIRPPKAG